MALDNAQIKTVVDSLTKTYKNVKFDGKKSVIVFVDNADRAINVAVLPTTVIVDLERFAFTISYGIYRIPIDWPEDLFNWLIDNFGRPNSSDKWDMHGGWIYIYKEECLSMFMLKWS